jgi:hypothetical protein
MDNNLDLNKLTFPPVNILNYVIHNLSTLDSNRKIVSLILDNNLKNLNELIISYNNTYNVLTPEELAVLLLDIKLLVTGFFSPDFFSLMSSLWTLRLKEINLNMDLLEEMKYSKEQEKLWFNLFVLSYMED